MLSVVNHFSDFVNNFSDCHHHISCLLQCKADLGAAYRQSAVPRSGPRCICLCAVVHPLLQIVRLAYLHHGFFLVAHSYLQFPFSRFTDKKLYLNWVKNSTKALAKRQFLIFSGSLNLFCFSETITGMWSWFRGFVLSHSYESDGRKEKKKDLWRRNLCGHVRLQLDE